MQGVIKKLMEKGFGFISSSELKQDLFFHMRSLEGVRFEELQEGDKVSFEVADGRDGRANAIKVRLVDMDTTDEQEDDMPMAA